MLIRLATKEDTGEVCRVVRAVYDEYGFTWDPEEYHADLYDLDAAYFGRGHLFWVAELDGRVVGTVALEFFDTIPGESGSLFFPGALTSDEPGERSAFGTQVSIPPSPHVAGIGGPPEGGDRHGDVNGVERLDLALQQLPRVSGTDCSLERLYVDPDARRRGVGSRLTETVIDEARKRGKRAMELWSDKRFGDAHRLYGRYGARVVGDRICDDPDVSPEWGLYLLLD